MSLLRHGPDKKKKILYQGQSRRKLLQERDTINLVGLKGSIELRRNDKFSQNSL